MAELVLRLKGRIIKAYPIDKPELSIGREPSCDVFIDNPGISRCHATVSMTDTGFEIITGGSANGTYVNGNQIKKPQELKNGDEMMIGKFALTYLAHSGPSFVVTPESQARTPSAGEAAVHNPERTLHLNQTEIAHLLEKPEDRQPTASSPRVHSGALQPVPRQQVDQSNTVRVLAILLLLTLLVLVVMAIMFVLK